MAPHLWKSWPQICFLADHRCRSERRALEGFGFAGAGFFMTQETSGLASPQPHSAAPVRFLPSLRRGELLVHAAGQARSTSVEDYFRSFHLCQRHHVVARTMGQGRRSKLKPTSFTRKKSCFDGDSSPDFSSLGMGRNCVTPTWSTEAFVGSFCLALNPQQPLQDHDLQLSIYPEGCPSRRDSNLSRNGFLSGCL